MEPKAMTEDEKVHQENLEYIENELKEENEEAGKEATQVSARLPYGVSHRSSPGHAASKAGSGYSPGQGLGASPQTYRS